MIQTYEAVYESGVIRLPADVRLPEHTMVYVVVPQGEEQPRLYVGSPHLVHPQQATDFVKEVVEEGVDASIR
jgi:hypothetical protein